MSLTRTFPARYQVQDNSLRPKWLLSPRLQQPRTLRYWACLASYPWPSSKIPGSWRLFPSNINRSPCQFVRLGSRINQERPIFWTSFTWLIWINFYREKRVIKMIKLLAMTEFIYKDINFHRLSLFFWVNSHANPYWESIPWIAAIFYLHCSSPFLPWLSSCWNSSTNTNSQYWPVRPSPASESDLYLSPSWLLT